MLPLTWWSESSRKCRLKDLFVLRNTNKWHTTTEISSYVLTHHPHPQKDDMIFQQILSCLLVLRSNCVGFSFVLFSFEFTIVSVSCFFCRWWQHWADRAELNAQLTHYLCFRVWGRDATRLFYLILLMGSDLFSIILTWLIHISDRFWKSIDFFRVFFIGPESDH